MGYPSNRTSRRAPSFHKAYKEWLGLKTLQEVTSIIQKFNLSATIAGGFAYDGIRGQLTKTHGDLDICCLSIDVFDIYKAFEQMGFHLYEKSFHVTEARKRGLLKVDIFQWRTSIPGTAEFASPTQLCRVPLEVFQGKQWVQLNGLEFEIPSNEQLKAILPFITCAASKEFVNQLPTRPSFSFRKSQRLESYTIQLANPSSA